MWMTSFLWEHLKISKDNNKNFFRHCTVMESQSYILLHPKFSNLSNCAWLLIWVMENDFHHECKLFWSVTLAPLYLLIVTMFKTITKIKTPFSMIPKVSGFVWADQVSLFWYLGYFCLVFPPCISLHSTSLVQAYSQHAGGGLKGSMQMGNV